MKNRETGYYWVKYKYTDWMVCRWVKNGRYWRVPNSINEYLDEDFEQIDERKIENPNENISM